jgi:hypothetical protein
MKVKTAVTRVWNFIAVVSTTRKPTRADYMMAEKLLKKYQRQFGNRHFNQHLRTCIKNGLWETGELV